VGIGPAAPVTGAFRVRDAAGTVLARRAASASAKPSFALVERVVRLVAVLAEVLEGLPFIFGDTDDRGRGAGEGAFLGVIFIPVFNPPSVSISTTLRRLNKRKARLFFSSHTRDIARTSTISMGIPYRRKYILLLGCCSALR
jgi:hypothetical protein